MTQYARVRHDLTNARWGFLSRSNLDNPKSLDKHQIIKNPWQAEVAHVIDNTGKLAHLSAALQKLVKLLNAATTGFTFVSRRGSGWLNSDTWPTVEPLVFCGNVVEVLKIQGSKVYINTIKDTSGLSGVTYERNPTLVHVFTIIDPARNIHGAPVGIGHAEARAYVLPVVKGTTAYMDIGDLELFPALPFPATVTVDALNVRSDPFGAVVGQVVKGYNGMITEYQCLGSNVWGKVSSGWIALYHQSIAGGYSTTWSMQTTPPN